jgi:hypothetical protein
MNIIYVKKPFLTDAEKRVQNWLLRGGLEKMQPPNSTQELARDADKTIEITKTGDNLIT